MTDNQGLRCLRWIAQGQEAPCLAVAPGMHAAAFLPRQLQVRPFSFALEGWGHGWGAHLGCLRETL